MAIGLCVFTKSIGTPFDNMGVMTIKIMSNTSITSTMGVTLMSDTAGGACLLQHILHIHTISPIFAARLVSENPDR